MDQHPLPSHWSEEGAESATNQSEMVLRCRKQTRMLIADAGARGEAGTGLLGTKSDAAPSGPGAGSGPRSQGTIGQPQVTAKLTANRSH
jgi:hypothetical protein